MHEIADLLRQHPFAAGLEDGIIALVAGCARNVVFPAGAYVFREGAAADEFILVRHGTVALECHAPGHGSLAFLTVRDGEMLGASWLIPPHRHTFDARAVTLTRALSFDGRCLREKAEADHHVGYELMKRFIPPLIERLRLARMQGLEAELDCGPVSERWVNLAQAPGGAVPGQPGVHQAGVHQPGVHQPGDADETRRPEPR